MQIIDRGIVVASRPGSERSSCCYAYLAVLPGGRWLVGFRAAPKKADTRSRSLLTWSDDQGRTWSEPIEPVQPIAVDGKEGDWRAFAPTSLGGGRVAAVLYWVDQSDPSRPFFNAATEGLLDSRLFLSLSEDQGETWSPPRPIDTSPYQDQPTPITGPLLMLPDGTWAVQFELNKTYLDPRPWRHASCLTFSRDQGRTWSGATATARHSRDRVFYWDQRPAVLGDGSLLDLFWTYDLDRAEYLNIHASRSTDGGRSWSAVWDTGVAGQPAPPRSLPDGRLAMVYVDRTTTPIIKLRTSTDGGHSFPAETELTLHAPEASRQIVAKHDMPDAWAEMGRYSIGLPHTQLVPGNQEVPGTPGTPGIPGAEGDLLAIYYTGPHSDQTSIEWVRLRAIASSA